MVTSGASHGNVFWPRVFYALFGFSAIEIFYSVFTGSFSPYSLVTQAWIGGFVLFGFLSAVFWSIGRAWHNAYERADGRDGLIRLNRGRGYGGVNSGDWATDPNSAAYWMSRDQTEGRKKSE
jgi:hypothetical protein